MVSRIVELDDPTQFIVMKIYVKKYSDIYFFEVFSSFFEQIFGSVWSEHIFMLTSLSLLIYVQLCDITSFT